MTDIPIIFSAPMIRALLAGRKTMTRRLLYSKRKARNGTIPASATVLQDHAPPCPPLGADGFPTDIGPVDYIPVAPDATVTEFYGCSALYALRPCTEEIVRDHLKRSYEGDMRPIRSLDYRPEVEDRDDEEDEAA